MEPVTEPPVAASEPAPVSGSKPPVQNAPRPNGMTDEQVQTMLAALGRHKNNPDYLKRGEEGIVEFRRQIQEELERELAEEGK